MDQPRAHSSDADWQLVGELELPGGVEAQPLIRAWLAEVLIPLQLPADFRDRIWQSTAAVAGRAGPIETVSAAQHPGLRLWIPADRPRAAPAWGFFWVETVETAAAHEGARDRSIELYLFPEGQ